MKEKLNKLNTEYRQDGKFFGSDIRCRIEVMVYARVVTPAMIHDDET